LENKLFIVVAVQMQKLTFFLDIFHFLYLFGEDNGNNAINNGAFQVLNAC
jgi:hypothetical protein